MRTVLLSTVGTSLIDGNLRHLSGTTPNRPDNWGAIKDAYEAQRWHVIGRELTTLNPMERLVGAEINAIEFSLRKGWLNPQRIIFFISDTERGRQTGEVLESYFMHRVDLGLQDVRCQVIEHLHDESPSDFKTHGLRNLVRAIGEQVRHFGAGTVAIDATGGYKAQIAVAVLMGQVLQLPVFYKHEKFKDIIEFPPLPVSFDYDLLGENADVLSAFERGEAFRDKDLTGIDPRLRPFLNEVESDGEVLFELGAVGQVYLEGYRLRNPKPLVLRDAADTEKSAPTLPQHHFPTGFVAHLQKVWAAHNWIKSVHVPDFGKQGQLRRQGTGFHVANVGSESRLMGTYVDQSGFGARFVIHLTDESRPAQTWAADYLNRIYGT